MAQRQNGNKNDFPKQTESHPLTKGPFQYFV